ncbi:MAG: hypothetical protein KatS3mg031_1449 [Chitinophagales bacterium]|nr:MAG: hypothetical protein KatS3mg031_1449 [Chitinophagales bacterium]
MNYSFRCALAMAVGICMLPACDDSCSDVICSAPNSTCVEGRCVCIAGYEGANCDQLSYVKFEGSYQVSENCLSSSGGSQNKTYSASIYRSGSRIDIITINNLGSLGIAADATIVDATRLYLSRQNAGLTTINGGQGTYEETTRRIRLEYQYNVGGSVAYECTAIFSKF